MDTIIHAWSNGIISEIVLISVPIFLASKWQIWAYNMQVYLPIKSYSQYLGIV